MVLKLTIGNNFKELKENILNGVYKSPLDIPVEMWGDMSWELLDTKEIEEILLPFLNFSFKRAKTTMSVYNNIYKKNKINSFEEFNDIPILVKDSTNLNVGFRKKINKNPFILLPKDVKKSYQIYKSGGTKGIATPTFITQLDREIESYGFSRGFKYSNFDENDIVLSTYNPTHKGGEEAKEAILKLGAKYIPKRLTDTAEDLIKTIEDYNVNALITAQGPISYDDKTKKGSGINLLELIKTDNDVILEKIDKVVLGGYSIIEEVINWADAYKKQITSLLGSSEAIPQAGSTSIIKNNICKLNNLHLFNGPHYIEVLKEENGSLVPVKTGETGLLVYTTIAREGTVYIRYAPGDQAKLLKDHGECNCGLKSKVISEIKRIDSPNEIISTGCCVG